jgi:hypothetical protein
MGIRMRTAPVLELMPSNREKAISDGLHTRLRILSKWSNGVTGRVDGTFLNSDISAIVMAGLPSNQADRVAHILKRTHAARKQESHEEHPILLKMFSLPCEEHS